MIKKGFLIALLLSLLLLLSGCQTILQPHNPRPKAQEAGPTGQDDPVTAYVPGDVGIEETAPTQTEPTETVPVGTIPPDGDPGNVTCKGSYTGSVNSSTVVATSGEESLTLGVLQAYYWAEVAQYRASGAEEMPDFSRPLDSQVCMIDGTVYSWQQHFLKKALNTWHAAQALNQVSREDPIYRDPKYNPIKSNHEKYMDGMPVLPLLYGYSTEYRPNSMHQAYLDALPQYLEELAQARGYGDVATMAWEAFGCSMADLKNFAESYNRGYMYLTYLSYYLEPTQEQAEAEYTGARTGEKLVDLRHILLAPGDEGEEEAGKLDKDWQGFLKKREADFAELAAHNSLDSGTSNDGGAYYRIAKGQTPAQIDQWCFDEERKPGDHTVMSLEDGVHMLYFVGSREAWQADAMDALTVRMEQELIEKAKKRFPMKVNYSGICLGSGDAAVAGGEILYQDIAHERIPEVPLYLQQDYMSTQYGPFWVYTNGCGITAMSMLASYMADDELTVPIMCARFGNRYSLKGGTDGTLFSHEPQAMGFYMMKKTYDEKEAYQALKDGHVVVVLQLKGYWTSGGHYLVLEKLTEDGQVQVRDSNTFNYNNRVPTHQEDKHPWSKIIGAAEGYWIYDYKITRIPLCSRCGDPAATQGGLVADYCCHKCRTALLRREAYLTEG